MARSSHIHGLRPGWPVLCCALVAACCPGGEADGPLAAYGRLAEAAAVDAAAVWREAGALAAAGPADAAAPRLLVMRWPRACGGEDLLVQLGVADGETSGLAYAPGWNAALHPVRVDESVPTGRGRRLHCTLLLASDGERPRPGETAALPFTCTLRIDGHRVAGRAATTGCDQVYPRLPPFEAGVEGVVLAVGAPAPPPADLPAPPAPSGLDAKRLHAACGWHQALCARSYRVARAALLAGRRNLDAAAAFARWPDRLARYDGYRVASADAGNEDEEKKTEGGAEAGELLGELDELIDTADAEAELYDPDAAAASLPAARAASRHAAQVRRILAAADDPAPAPRAGPEPVADPRFGPWFGDGPLSHSPAGANRLPEDVGAAGAQDWPYLSGWRVAGPFPAADELPGDPGLPSLIGGDRAVFRFPLPPARPGEEPETGETRWRPAAVDAGTGLASWKVGRGASAPLCYLATELHAPRDCELWLAAGIDGRGAVWLDGRQVLRTAGPRRLENPVLGRVRLRAGLNHLLLRCEGARAWARVCVRGRPAPADEAARRRAAVSAAYEDLANLRPGVRGFRGDGTACYPDAHPPSAWDLESGANVLWRVPFARTSKGQPLVVGDRVLVQEDPHFLYCLDAASGERLWRVHHSAVAAADPGAAAEDERRHAAWLAAEAALREAGADAPAEERKRLERARRAAHQAWWGHYRKHGGCPKSSPWDGAPHGPWVGYTFATPVTDGERVWVKCGTGAIACYDLDGTRRWLAHCRYRVGGHDGLCPSPVLVGDTRAGAGRLVVPVHAPREKETKRKLDDDLLVAYDADTGAEAWRAPCRLGGTSSPVGMRLSDGAGTMDVVVTAGGTVVRGADGAVLVEALPGGPGSGTATPVGARLLRFGTKYGYGYAHDLVMLDRDRVGARVAWAIGGTVCAGGWAYREGLCYALQGSQFGGSYRIVDAATGRMLERAAGFGIDGVGALQEGGDAYVPTVIAGELVYLANRGPRDRRVPWAGVTVVQTGPTGCYLAHNRMENYLTAPPAPAGERLYIRNDGFLTCIGHTGEAGRAYEAVVNARNLLDDLALRVPDTAPAPRVTAASATPPRRPLRTSKPYDDWRAAGPLPAARARAVAAGEETVAFRAFTKEERSAVWTTWRRRPRSLDLPAAVRVLGGEGDALVLAGELGLRRERVLRVVLPGDGLHLRIGDHELGHGDRLRAGPGVHPFRVYAPLAAGTCYLHFLPSEDAAAERSRWRAAVERCRPLFDRALAAGDTELQARIRALLERLDDGP